MEELKPCPFCGGDVSIKIHDFSNGTRLYTPKCKCGAGIVRVFDTEAEAIAAWNTRAERTCKPILAEDGFACDKCGYWWPLKHYDNGKPCYCPNCGAKVVKR